MPTDKGKQIKANEKSSNIPILFLSALDKTADKVKGFEARAVDFITKPFQAEEVLARVDAHITLSRLSRNLEEQVEKRTVELRESEERFRAFMDNSPALAYIKNESGKHIYANKTLCDTWEITPDQFIGTNTNDFFQGDVAKKIEAYDEEIRKKGVPLETDDYSNELLGQVRWWKEMKFPINFPSGDRMVGGLAFDITARKLDEQKLKKAFKEIEKLKNHLEQENIYLQEEIQLQHKHEEMIGKSDAIKQVLRQAEQVAETDSTVLILGETGVGKELLARAIHRMSSRKNRSMHIVNCAAMPSSLIESEIFGCEKGAFTGALSRRIGRFEIADGSTIFLDEIGELSMEMQMKLLRVLEGGQFERLGGNKTVKVDVRVIAATNKDLEKSVHEGGFRRDLYYRLNVFPITVPPLRDRIEDMDLLVWSFVKEFGERMGKRIERIPRKKIEALERYPWKGNVRELKNVIEQSMIVTRDTTMNVQLPGVPELVQDQGILLEDVERNHILKILEQTGWRVRGKDGAAECLGLKESTLRFRMKKLGIQRP